MRRNLGLFTVSGGTIGQLAWIYELGVTSRRLLYFEYSKNLVHKTGNLIYEFDTLINVKVE